MKVSVLIFFFKFLCSNLCENIYFYQEYILYIHVLLLLHIATNALFLSLIIDALARFFLYSFCHQL